MLEAVLIIMTAAAFVFGYFQVRKLDAFLDENVRRNSMITNFRNVKDKEQQ